MPNASAVIWRSRFVASGLAVVAVLALLIAALLPTGSGASSHREAPLIAADPQVDNTDVYAFVSPDAPSKVTLISNFIPFEEPAGGPNFYAFGERVRYDINIDNDHDARPDVIYRWIFQDHYRDRGTVLYNTGQVTSLTDPDLNFFQTYDLQRVVPGGETRLLVNDMVAAPSHTGDASMPDYAALRTQAIKRFGDTRRVFAGQAEDSFFLDLRVFDLLYGADFSEIADDTLKGFNVNTLALQVPKRDLADERKPGANPIIGVWSTASRRTHRIQRSNGDLDTRGDFVQVSRLGSPLVNEVVIPVGQKDRWNASKPQADGQFLRFVNRPILPEIVNAIYGLPIPDSNPDRPGVQRDDLIEVFLAGVTGLTKPDRVRPSEQLRLNMSIAPCEPMVCTQHSRLGVIGGDNAGFPNGRRLADDVIDIALQVVEGELIGNPNDLGDAVDNNDVTFGSSFPYVGLPHSGSNPDPH
jgi:hypothetical protein